jgi:hypothetical protein
MEGGLMNFNRNRVRLLFSPSFLLRAFGRNMKHRISENRGAPCRDLRKRNCLRELRGDEYRRVVNHYCSSIGRVWVCFCVRDTCLRPRVSFAASVFRDDVTSRNHLRSFRLQHRGVREMCESTENAPPSFTLRRKMFRD